jgi:hypothetical protein
MWWSRGLTAEKCHQRLLPSDLLIFMTESPLSLSIIHSRRLPLRQKLFLGLCAFLLLWNLITVCQKMQTARKARQKYPYIFLGYKFRGLNEILPGVKRLGYLTDKDMDARVNAMEFAQAEYILTPITLDLNNPDHEYLLLNYTTPSTALGKIKELHLTVWKQNQLGIILAKNPKIRTP